MARNADFLREAGFRVFAFDPFHHTGGSGWELGSVVDDPSRIPEVRFDLAFTSYVLNVVPHYLEGEIIDTLSRLAPDAEQLHITRNMDILDMVRKGLQRLSDPSRKVSKRDKVLLDYLLSEYLPKCLPGLRGSTLAWAALASNREAILDICRFGVETSAGFQRIPHLEEYGFSLVAKKTGYKAYTR
jgi:hypothetical protein